MNEVHSYSQTFFKDINIVAQDLSSSKFQTIVYTCAFVQRIKQGKN